MIVSTRDRATRAADAMAKAFGERAVVLLSDTSTENVAVIPTGSLSLDEALGVGGIPRGRVVEVYGPEASGKTTLTLNLIAEAQRAGGLAAFIDAEHALDRQYAEKLGVDVDSLLLAQPDSGEEALEIVEALIREAKVELIVIDSVAALVPRAEIAGEMGDTHVGLQARLMSQALRKLTPVIHKSGSTVVFINQIRMKIGVTFGSPETTAGGRALRFYASIRLDIRRIAGLKEGDKPVGNRVRVKVVKNKVAAPHGVAEFDIVFGQGIDRLGELIDLGVREGICAKSGSWYSYGDMRLGQGRTKSIALLTEQPETAEVLEADIRTALNLPAAAEPAGAQAKETKSAKKSSSQAKTAKAKSAGGSSASAAKAA
ncbi:MAG: recombination protein RecA [Myxococcota bacterium]|jgi:recombination protein RecA